MKKNSILFIPLLATCFSIGLYAETAVSKPGFTNTVTQDTLRSFSSKESFLRQYYQMNMNLFSYERVRSLDSMIDLKRTDLKTMSVKKDLSFQEYMKFLPSNAHEYGGLHRHTVFELPINLGNNYYDEDVIESWEYQKRLMYPYGHTPVDFYQP